jgi:hypothetical protein
VSRASFQHRAHGSLVLGVLTAISVATPARAEESSPDIAELRELSRPPSRYLRLVGSIAFGRGLRLILSGQIGLLVDIEVLP